MKIREGNDEISDYGDCGRILTYLEMLPFLFGLIAILLGALMLFGGGEDNRERIHEYEEHKQLLRTSHSGGKAVPR